MDETRLLTLAGPLLAPTINQIIAAKDEAQLVINGLSDQCAMLAARVAGLAVERDTLGEKLAVLEKKLAGLEEKRQRAFDSGYKAGKDETANECVGILHDHLWNRDGSLSSARAEIKGQFGIME